MSPDISSVIPRAIRDLASEVPTTLRVREYLTRALCIDGPPRNYVERLAAEQIAHELRPFLHHEWSYDAPRMQYVCTTSINKPLSRAELISLLSRAYQAGLDGR